MNTDTSCPCTQGWEGRRGTGRVVVTVQFLQPFPPPSTQVYIWNNKYNHPEGGGRASFSIITFIKLILDAAPAHCTVFTPLHSIYTTARRNLTKLANKNHSGRIQGGGWLWKLSPLANNKGSYCRSTPPPWISKNIWFLVGFQANVFKKLQAPPLSEKNLNTALGKILPWNKWNKVFRGLLFPPSKLEQVPLSTLSTSLILWKWDLLFLKNVFCWTYVAIS